LPVSAQRRGSALNHYSPENQSRRVAGYEHKQIGGVAEAVMLDLTRSMPGAGCEIQKDRPFR
jgi:hypothetical protein